MKKAYCKFCRKRIEGGKGQGKRNHCKSIECEERYITLRKKRKRINKLKYIQSLAEQERRIKLLEAKNVKK